MKEFKGKVAVITGGASGIGLAIAERCVQEGIKIVLSDVNQADLEKAEATLKASGGTVVSVRSDVSKRGDIEVLAKKAYDAFGAVHLLFNNAGVAGTDGSPWETTWNEWEWRLGVNLWGVINGIKIFIPLMLAQNTECHVVNTSSIVGLMAYHPSASYHVSKHAAVTLSENLYISLAKINAPIKVSVLCPFAVNTNIVASERNKPAELQDESGPDISSPEYQEMMDRKKTRIEAGMSPQVIADHVFKAIREDIFYILPAPEVKGLVQDWAEGIIQERNPRSLF